MRIIVMGSGGTGGYFGAKLARAGEDVTFVARGEHLRAIQAGGLSVTSATEGSWTVKAPAVERGGADALAEIRLPGGPVRHVGSDPLPGRRVPRGAGDAPALPALARGDGGTGPSGRRGPGPGHRGREHAQSRRPRRQRLLVAPPRSDTRQASGTRGAPGPHRTPRGALRRSHAKPLRRLRR